MSFVVVHFISIIYLLNLLHTRPKPVALEGKYQGKVKVWNHQA